MDKKDLLKFCRYYKGEDDCPFKEQNKVLFWNYEMQWVCWMLSETETILSQYLEEYIRAGFAKFEQFDDTPITLKALLFNRYNHWEQGDEFEKWYTNYYIN